MKIKEMFKKYWFVVIVAALFIIFISAYAISAIKNKEVKVSTLTKDGKDVIYSINGDDYYYADDLYNDLFESYGETLAFVKYYHEVLDKMIPTTDDLNNYAANWASYILQQEDEETTNEYMIQAGYNGIDDLTAYCLGSLKYQEFIQDLYINQADKYTQPVIDKENPRRVSHILIKVADVEEITGEDGTVSHKCNPTSEEKAKLDECLAALAKNDRAFGDIAQEYSEDGSASSGGLLGIVYESNKSQYVQEFADGCMEAKDGEIYGPVETQFGYHIIKVENVSLEELVADQDFLAVIQNSDPNLEVRIIMDKAKELGIEIKNDKVNDYIKKNLEAN